MTLPVTAVTIKEGKTTAPKHYTEDTLLSAMERLAQRICRRMRERKGIGTPATRAGILEKLVSTGFVERKKQKKTTTSFHADRRFPDYRPAGAASIAASDCGK